MLADVVKWLSFLARIDTEYAVRQANQRLLHRDYNMFRVLLYKQDTYLVELFPNVSTYFG